MIAAAKIGQVAATVRTSSGTTSGGWALGGRAKLNSKPVKKIETGQKYNVDLLNYRLDIISRVNCMFYVFYILSWSGFTVHAFAPILHPGPGIQCKSSRIGESRSSPFPPPGREKKQMPGVGLAAGTRA